MGGLPKDAMVDIGSHTGDGIDVASNFPGIQSASDPKLDQNPRSVKDFPTKKGSKKI